MLEVISLGAGVQSTTMALMAAHGEITPMPDAAIFADTGAEPPEVYEHLEWLKSGNVLPFPIVIGKASDIVADLRATASGGLGVAGRKGGYVGAPFHVKNPNGSHGLLGRTCTATYKIEEIERCAKGLLGKPREKPLRATAPLVRQWIGISSDEPHRVKWGGAVWRDFRYPLLSRLIKDDPDDLWMSRRDCEAWLRQHDYPVPPKSACTFCPFRSNAEWRALRDGSPEGWEQAVEIDRLIRDIAARSQTRLRPRGKLFVHRDGKPLDEVDLDNDAQPDLWSAECEGMCGL